MDEYIKTELNSIKERVLDLIKDAEESNSKLLPLLNHIENMLCI
jgi:hypothetical protein